ncbi:MAG: AraC family transcriptional regulator [Tissierellales bacterium]|jgi:AraC-like DNA-binding protein|nr:AraC family transcriptional regulator [Tissierellales bacterium]
MLHNFNSRLENLDGFETEYVKTLYYDLPKNYTGTYKSKNHLRFCTILEGEKELNLGSKSFKYTSDQFLIMPANTSVDMDIPIQTKALVFELNESLIKKVASNMPIYNNSSKKQNDNFILGTHNYDLKQDIKNIHNLTRSKSKQEAFLIDLYAQKLVYDLLKLYSPEQLLSMKSSTHIDQSIHYIRKHLHEPISIEKLSDMLGMSCSNFSHNFKKNYGMSPQKYINESKLKLATELLKDRSVTEVSFELGFESMSYFIKLFKKKYKLTPKQFQLNCL